MAAKIYDQETGEWLTPEAYRARQEGRPLPPPTFRPVSKPKPTLSKKQKKEVRLFFSAASLLMLGIFLLMLVVLIIGGLPYQRLTVAEFNGTVTDRFLCGDAKTSYCVAVIRDDGVTEVLTNQNSLWWWKWRGADLEPRFQRGTRLHFKVYGWRFGWPWTTFRNIISAEPIG